RLGRNNRLGQARRMVDMLHLVYHDTQDEKVYQVLSRRLKDKSDLFGGLPDTIEDDWIESVEKLEAMMDQYIHLRQQGRDVFELRYKETIDPDKNRWELCSRVLARKDVVEKLSESGERRGETLLHAPHPPAMLRHPQRPGTPQPGGVHDVPEDGSV